MCDAALIDLLKQTATCNDDKIERFFALDGNGTTSSSSSCSVLYSLLPLTLHRLMTGGGARYLDSVPAHELEIYSKVNVLAEVVRTLSMGLTILMMIDRRTGGEMTDPSTPQGSSPEGPFRTSKNVVIRAHVQRRMRCLIEAGVVPLLVSIVDVRHVRSPNRLARWLAAWGSPCVVHVLTLLVARPLESRGEDVERLSQAYSEGAMVVMTLSPTVHISFADCQTVSVLHRECWCNWTTRTIDIVTAWTAWTASTASNVSSVLDRPCVAELVLHLLMSPPYDNIEDPICHLASQQTAALLAVWLSQGRRTCVSRSFRAATALASFGISGILKLVDMAERRVEDSSGESLSIILADVMPRLCTAPEFLDDGSLDGSP